MGMAVFLRRNGLRPVCRTKRKKKGGKKMTGGGQMVKKSRVVFPSINLVSLSDVGILKVCH